MNKIFKGLIRFLIEVIVMTVLIVGINIFTNGMYLWGLPRINDIQSVNSRIRVSRMMLKKFRAVRTLS